MNTDNLCYFNVNHGDSRVVGRHRFVESNCVDQELDLTEEICVEPLCEGIVGQVRQFGTS